MITMLGHSFAIARRAVPLNENAVWNRFYELTHEVIMPTHTPAKRAANRAKKKAVKKRTSHKK